ncbi:F-box/FBD/LRR-repeat protein [Senna tora]|uniref:F-box/FBD/LRR-repeat protein n=1 Tax=Senna tora TaxID=362788 RepID=A0A834U1N0_9FABA|nr:F-box/FBD/LRR-repeat protein [Senna tora]
MMKADHDMPVDLISELPRNVIDHILEILPIRDAVRTSILSRKWKNMWLTVPRLEFADSFFEIPQGHEIPRVITEILLQHDGLLEQFILCIPREYPTRVRCLSLWIRYLSRSGIRDLMLVNDQPDPYEIPSHLFSCLNLAYLDITNFAMKPPPPDFGGFKSLTGLHMFSIRIESDVLESLISGCPLLVNLSISGCIGFDCLSISAPNLQVLVILDHRAFKSICLKNLKNLVDLNIILNGHMEDLEGGRRSNLVDYFSSLPKVEKLHLAGSYITFLSLGYIPETLPNMIYSLKHLQLCGISFNNPRHISLLVCLLKSSPNLVEFDVKISNLESLPVFSCFGEPVSNFCSFNQLRTVFIIVDTIFEPAVGLAKYILANSPLLEILSFMIDHKQSDAAECEASHFSARPSPSSILTTSDILGLLLGSALLPEMSSSKRIPKPKTSVLSEDCPVERYSGAMCPTVPLTAVVTCDSQGYPLPCGPIQRRLRLETGSDASVGHVGIHQEPLGGSDAEAVETKEVPVHGEAYHLHFSLELSLSTSSIDGTCCYVFEPFHCYDSSSFW